jgi:trimethylamine:corrinoid methyltransferase-like protein
MVKKELATSPAVTVYFIEPMYISACKNLAKFEEQYSGIKLTDSQKLKHWALKGAIDRTDAESKKLRNILDEERVKHLQAGLARDSWARSELNRRKEEEAAKKAAAAKAAEPTLSERWAKFTQKLTG